MRIIHRLRHRLFLAGLALSICSTAYAETQSWKTDCVGRFQLSIPGVVEVAEYRPNAKYDVGTRFRFNDGSIAYHSKGYHSGSVHVTEKAPLSDYLERVEKGKAAMLRQKGELASSEYETDRMQAKGTMPVSFSDTNIYGWISQAQSSFAVWLDMYKNERIVSFQVSGMASAAEANDAAQEFVRAFRPRPMFNLPKGEGVCIPYGFISDDGKPGRQVGVTMRLIDHPDIEIFFEDRSAVDYGIKQTVQTQERTELSMLWQQQAHSSRKIDLSFGRYHTIKLDGRSGTGSFVEITRKDGTLDYGYAAVVNGDHTAPTDAPQLMFYVIRTASRAKGKPVSKNELKDMAYKIAASIKRREVK